MSISIKEYVSFFALALCVIACDPANPKTEKTVADTAVAAKPAPAKEYPVAMVNNKKDPTCGMPVTAGIGDTAHYKDKVIGFCSAECKAEFVKNPAASIAAAELK